MYLTAHRVVSPTGRSGINAFRYLHGESTSVDWTNPDPSLISDVEPGTLASEVIEVIPGGNVVRSSLDIVAHDATTPRVLRDALVSFRAQHLKDLPAIMRGPVSVRFNAEIGLPPEGIPQEFETLAARIEALFQLPPEANWRAREPLCIQMSRSEEETSFQLAASAVERIQKQSPAWKPRRIRVRDEVRDDLAFFRGDILRDLVRSLLPEAAEEELLRFGGVRVIDSSGSVVTEWPIRRTLGSGYCLNCRQHNTLVREGVSWRCSNCSQAQENNGLWVATLT